MRVSSMTILCKNPQLSAQNERYGRHQRSIHHKWYRNENRYSEKEVTLLELYLSQKGIHYK